MLRIDREDYDAISKWINKANNFIGSQADCDGNVGWYVLRQNRHVKVLELLSEEHIHTTITPEAYVVDENVYARWKEEFGYTI